MQTEGLDETVVSLRAAHGPQVCDEDLVVTQNYTSSHRAIRQLPLTDVVVAAPHVLDRILDDDRTWRGLRHTSRHFKHAVDARMYRHICIKAICGRSPASPLVTITRPCGLSLPGFPPRTYSPPARSLWARLTGATQGSVSDTFWGSALTHTRTVDLDLGSFRDTSLEALRPHLRPHTLRIHLSTRGHWIPKSPHPTSCPLSGAQRVVLFPNAGGSGHHAQSRVNVLSACQRRLEKLVVNVLVSLDGRCLFPPVDPFDRAIDEAVLIFTLLPSDSDKHSRPHMQSEWNVLLDTLLKPHPRPRPITLVGMPNIDFMPLLRKRGKPGATPPSSVALFREVLRRRGAEVGLFLFISRDQYARSIGMREFELESHWDD